MAKYSIIMPVYNAEDVLQKSIRSIIEQSFDDWELITINDGSTDSSLEILKTFERKDSRIRALTQNHSGPGAARNLGMNVCGGDYIAFLDADDYWEKDFLELVQKEISFHESLDIVFIDTINERTDGSIIGYSNTYSFKQMSKHELLCNQMTGNLSWGMGKVIRKELIKNSKPFAELAVGEEAVFSFDVLYNANRIGFVEKPIYHYVQSSTGQHKKGDNDPWKPVVESMKQHLQDLNLYEDFESTINSFALRSLCICTYRCSCNFPKKIAIGLMKKKLEEYRREFDFSNLDVNSLDKHSRMILFFMKMGLFFPIYMASILRKKKLAY